VACGPHGLLWHLVFLFSVCVTLSEVVGDGTFTLMGFFCEFKPDSWPLSLLPVPVTGEDVTSLTDCSCDTPL